MERLSSIKAFLKKRYILLLTIGILLITVRIILPYVVLHYANKTLADIDGYYGHIDDVDIALIRGAYRIESIYLDKVNPDTDKKTTFFKAKTIEISLEWSALLHGSIVGELTVESPELTFTKNKTELAELEKDSPDFRELLSDFVPLKVNRFEINNGAIHYVDFNSNPKINVSLTGVHILAVNLTNVVNDEVELPSTVTAYATLYEGSLTFNMRLDALDPKITFDLNAELKNTKLRLLNEFLKAYGNIDVSQGTFGLYTEIATKNGKFKGYVKPIIKNLKVKGLEDKNDKFLNKIWESIVGAAGVILRNQKEDQVATKIPIAGTFKNPKVSTLDAVWEVLRNAFVQALMSSVDHEIDLGSVNTENPGDKKNILKKIFTDDKKK